jgi:hypothetical protein
MLVPVIVRVNVKVEDDATIVLEDVVETNLPLLFPEVSVFNRNASSGNVTVLFERVTVWADQSDNDFDGTATKTIVSSFSLGANSSSILSLSTNSLTGESYGQTNELTLTNAGPADEVLVSVVIKGMIETSITPDPNVVVNG